MATRTNNDIPLLAEQVVKYLGQHPEMLQQFVDHPYTTVQQATKVEEKLDRTDMSQLLTLAAALAGGQTQSAQSVDPTNLATLAGNLLGQNDNSIHELAGSLFGAQKPQQVQQTQQAKPQGGLDLGSLVSLAALAGGLYSASKVSKKKKEQQQLQQQQQGIDFTDGLDAAEMAQLAGSFLSGQTTEQAAQSTGIDLGTVANIASLFLGK